MRFIHSYPKYTNYKMIKVLMIAIMIITMTTSAMAQNRPKREVKWVNPELPVGAGLSHHILKSKAMGHELGYVVWTPINYEKKKDQRYPVVYFLHGVGGNESADSAGFSGHIVKAIKDDILKPVICVFPNGGMSGYRGDVEDMIIKELIPLIDKSYHTLAKPESQVIAGFSMGGAGAVRLAIMYPDLFSAAASWGGGARKGSTALFEAALRNAEILKKNHVAFLQIKGDQDRPEGNKEFAKHLDKLDITNELIILPDTNHNLGLYYKRSAKQMMQFIARHIQYIDKGKIH